eukprot:TRINITY_DN197_c0_g1_i13.p1 TRINITY_DN197_c0_g1~~TRINITY_DN197_c0_g1_i13.p1  ORF type:complete len:174 (-),score=78.98 TRINITY_DN197_c0_g1_i13:160-681(-)
MKSCGMSEKKEKRLAKFCADPAATVAHIAKKHDTKKCIRKAIKATGKCPKHMKKTLKTKSNAADVALACSDACKEEVVKAAEGCGAQKLAKKASKKLAKRCSSSLLQDDEDSEDEDVEDALDDEEEDEDTEDDADEEEELEESGSKKKCYKEGSEGFLKIDACPKKKLKKFTS